MAEIIPYTPTLLKSSSIYPLSLIMSIFFLLAHYIKYKKINHTYSYCLMRALRHKNFDIKSVTLQTTNDDWLT